MAMSLGGTSLSSSIEERGRYRYEKPILRYNGDGEAVTAGYAKITWTFPFLVAADYTWIRDTLLGGAFSVTYSSGSLLDDKGAAISITNAVAYRPTYEYAANAVFENVTWTIDRVAT